MQKLKQCFLFYLLPACALLLFAFMMNSTRFLQQSFPANGPFSSYTTQLEENIKAQAWEEAQASFGELQSAWKQVSPRLQLAAEKDKLEELDENMARLSALIECQDQAAALSELYAAANNWINISR